MPKLKLGFWRKMKELLSSSYRRLVVIGAHSSLIYLLCGSILLISVGGVISSSLMFLLIGLGSVTLIFDPSVRQALFGSKELHLIAGFLILILVWQAIGILLRHPSDPKATSVLGSALGIFMLLPVLAAAMLHDDKFRDQVFRILFVMGSLAAAISLFRHFLKIDHVGSVPFRHLLLYERLTPIGRAEHPILGAGGLASSFFAGLALYTNGAFRRKGLIALGLAIIALTVLMTQSRGPLLGIILAILAIGCIGCFRSSYLRDSTAFGFVLLCFLIPVCLIVMEPWIKSLICASQINICRPSNRQEVWENVLGFIAERPFLGIGPTFRFTGGAVSHPHNGFLGLIFYFGIPTGLLFIGVIFLALKQALHAPRRMERTFALLGIFFSASFVATDLSNPFSFVNTHYLYLWLPVFIGAVAGSLREESNSKVAPVTASC